ncbi:MAG: DNA-binding protein [Thermoplasmata archaeon]
MDYKIEKNIVVAKLDHGANIFQDIKDILSELDRNSGMVVSGIGMLKDFKLGYYNSKNGEYSWENFHEPMELVNLGGSISDEGTIHLHASISGEDHMLRGGHLDNGTIFNVVEMVILVFDDVTLTRKYDKSRKMNLLSMR